MEFFRALVLGIFVSLGMWYLIITAAAWIVR